MYSEHRSCPHCQHSFAGCHETTLLPKDTVPCGAFVPHFSLKSTENEVTWQLRKIKTLNAVLISNFWPLQEALDK